MKRNIHMLNSDDVVSCNNERYIAITGFAGSGKSTIQSYICKEYGFVAINFADILKDIVAVTFSFPRHLLEGDTDESREWRDKASMVWTDSLQGTKFSRMISSSSSSSSSGSLLEEQLILKKDDEVVIVTPRKCLQYYADVLKENFGDDFFCLKMEEKMRELGAKRVIFADVRFPNEYKLIKKLGADFCRVTRKISTPSDLNSLHKSETSLLFHVADFTFENEGTIKDLTEKVDQYMQMNSIAKIDSIEQQQQQQMMRGDKEPAFLNFESSDVMEYKNIPLLAPQKRYLRIGCDIDGVLYEFHQSFKTFLHEKHGKPLSEMMSEPKNWQFYEDWGLSGEEFKKYYREGINEQFILRKGNMIGNASIHLKKFMEQGHSVHLISNRKIEGAEYYSLHNTIHWLKENAIEYTTLDFDSDKRKYVEKYSLDLFIEDSPLNAKQVSEAGCKNVLLYDQLWNSHKEYPTLTRVKNWDDIANEVDRIFSSK